MYSVSWLYLAVLRMAAFSAAELGLDAESDMYDSAVKHATVTSQVRGLTFCHGMSVRPSGLLQSVRNSPYGSSTAGNPGMPAERIGTVDGIIQFPMSRNSACR